MNVFVQACVAFWLLMPCADDLWLAAPLIWFIALFFVCRFWSRDSNPGWGMLVFLGFSFDCFGLFFGQLLCQCDLLLTRLGLMPCSAWSRKKTFHRKGVWKSKCGCAERSLHVALEVLQDVV